MDTLLSKVNRYMENILKPAPAPEQVHADQVGEAARILEHAIEYLQGYGVGRDLEFSNARFILNMKLNEVWSELGGPARFA